MPGGAPQGTLLGVLTFVLQMNGVRAVPHIPLDQHISAPRIKQPNTTSKYIDDLTAASVINLKTQLKPLDVPIRPVSYHGRTEQYLPDDKNPLIDQLNNIITHAKANQMKLNVKKTKVMTFTKSRSLDFQPKIFIEDKLLDVVENQKLLGVMISSDLKWTAHIKSIRKKFMTKIWMLRRIKELGGSQEDLKLVYILQVFD